jgi:hypothetical protein
LPVRIDQLAVEAHDLRQADGIFTPLDLQAVHTQIKQRDVIQVEKRIVFERHAWFQ